MLLLLHWSITIQTVLDRAHGIPFPVTCGEYKRGPGKWHAPLYLPVGNLFDVLCCVYGSGVAQPWPLICHTSIGGLVFTFIPGSQSHQTEWQLTPPHWLLTQPGWVVCALSWPVHTCLSIDIMLETGWWSYPTPTAMLIITLNDQETNWKSAFWGCDHV